ncbi:MAG: FkbM family methyltransferase [Alphaproteobacteria bacterium]|nr:FkbM family methyltransferase [Alphaproteobacteria bacterium]
MNDVDPAVVAERRFAASLPLPYLRYRWLRWRQKRARAKTDPARIAPRTDGLLMEVDEADIIDFNIRHFGAWEPALGALIAAHLKPGDRAVDIGANIGAHTLTMAKAVGAGGLVTAIEPGKTTAARLRRNAEINGLLQIRVLEVAASDAAGRASLFAGPDGTRGRATMDAEVAGSGASAEIETIIAADACTPEDWKRTRLMKIDVERAEDKVLRGLAPVLSLLPEDAVLIVETEPQLLARRGAPIESLVAPLLQRGARFHALEQHADLKSMMKPLRFSLKAVEPKDVQSTSHTDFVIARPDVVAGLAANPLPLAGKGSY